MYVRFAVREKISFPKNNGFAAGGASPAAFVLKHEDFEVKTEMSAYFKAAGSLDVRGRMKMSG